MGKGLTIVAAHDTHETEDWNSAKIIDLFFGLAAKGRFNLKGLVTHRFAPKEFGPAYHLANTKRNETMGILFNWP
jgi:threonine dehydrogenase-like Zn-dependent dehydrogenase